MYSLNVSGLSRPLVTTFSEPFLGFRVRVRKPYFGFRGFLGSVRASNSRSEVYVFSGCQSGSSVCLYHGIVLFVGSFTVSVSKSVLSLDVFSRLSVYRVSSI